MYFNGKIDGGMIGRLALEGCKSFADEEVKRCFSNCVAPQCCISRLEKAIENGYTYSQYLIDVGVVQEHDDVGTCEYFKAVDEDEEKQIDQFGF